VTIIEAASILYLSYTKCQKHPEVIQKKCSVKLIDYYK